MIRCLLILGRLIRIRFPSGTFASKSEGTTHSMNHVSGLIKKRKYFLCQLHTALSDVLTTPCINPEDHGK